MLLENSETYIKCAPNIYMWFDKLKDILQKMVAMNMSYNKICVV